MDIIDANTKYKRWGWGAVIALVGVILIAGLVVAVSMSSPKPNSSDNVATTSVETENGANGGSNSNENGGDAQSGNDAQSEAQKKAEEEKKAAEAQKKAEEEAAAKKKAEEERIAREQAARNSGNLPKTGPVDSLIGFVALAIIVYLGALNLSFLKK